MNSTAAGSDSYDPQQGALTVVTTEDDRLARGDALLSERQAFVVTHRKLTPGHGGWLRAGR
jgi:hypothetical protein